MDEKKCDICDESDRKEMFHRACVQAVAFYCGFLLHYIKFVHGILHNLGKCFFPTKYIFKETH